MQEKTYTYGDHSVTWTQMNDLWGEDIGPEILVEAGIYEDKAAVTLNIGHLLFTNSSEVDYTGDFDEDGNEIVVAAGTFNWELSPSEARTLAAAIAAQASCAEAIKTIVEEQDMYVKVVRDGESHRLVPCGNSDPDRHYPDTQRAKAILDGVLRKSA